MHYIIGTTILINETHAPKPGGSINDMRAPRKRVNMTPFETGVEYSLYNITKVDDVFEYTFYAAQTQEMKAVHFNSPTDADNYIAHLRGEQLPDYSQMRRGRFD